MVVKVACLLVLVVRLGRRGTGLVGVLNGVLAAVEHEFGPQCKSQAPPDLPEVDDGLACRVLSAHLCLNGPGWVCGRAEFYVPTSSSTGQVESEGVPSFKFPCHPQRARF